ncbi:MAG TPA: hypothetical protein ACFCUC_06385 [Desulfobacterales bacterium]
MPLPAKKIGCQCGHTMTLTTRKLRCVKCGGYLFYNDGEKRRHRINAFYMIAMFVLAGGFLTFLFVELIVEPLMLLK